MILMACSAITRNNVSRYLISKSETNLGFEPRLNIIVLWTMSMKAQPSYAGVLRPLSHETQF